MVKNIERQLVGTWGEYFIIEKLLSKKYELYIPIVDSGTDLIIKKENSSYSEVQIKTVSKTCKDPLWFQITDLEPKENFFIICVSEKYERYWVLPSFFFYEKASKSKSQSKDKIKMIFDLNIKNKIDIPEFNQYENNLDIL